MFVFDHVAISCETLAEGTTAVEAALGVPLGPVGQHPHFATHNRLLSLGGTEYLEVIAVDPDMPPPDRPRWFDIDRFSGAPRPTNWILSCPDMTDALDRCGPDVGAPVALARGDYRWRMAVPANGRLPFDNLHPALICWDSAHPAPRLPNRGCSLVQLVVRHPQAQALAGRLGLADDRITFETGAPGLVVTIDTPNGHKTLG